MLKTPLIKKKLITLRSPELKLWLELAEFGWLEVCCPKPAFAISFPFCFLSSYNKFITSKILHDYVVTTVSRYLLKDAVEMFCCCIFRSARKTAYCISSMHNFITVKFL